jgi:hypothetical protein
MVFTWPMRIGKGHPAQGHPAHGAGQPWQRLTRRGALRAAVAAGAVLLTGAGATGCDLLHLDPASPAGPDELAELRAATAALADWYDATIRRHPALSSKLGPLRDAHRAHLDALERQLVGTRTPAAGPSNTEAAVPGDPVAAVSALLAAEKAGVSAAGAACLSAPAWQAALLGSIAAARASHVEVLT